METEPTFKLFGKIKIYVTAGHYPTATELIFCSVTP